MTTRHVRLVMVSTNLGSKSSLKLIQNLMFREDPLSKLKLDGKVMAQNMLKSVDILEHMN